MAYTTIDKPSDYFNTVLYTGDGSFPSSKTGVGFQPDFIWIKRRNAVASHVLSDSIRGVTKTLYTDSTSAELTNNTYGWVSAFGSDGFSVNQSGSSGENVNASGSTYASWNWLANGTGSANTDGSINSTVSANTTAGFSIVSYTGNNTAGATIGHGLGKVPEVMLIKGRTANADNWRSYHKSLPDPTEDYIKLNSTDAKIDGAHTTWNSTGPTSSVFSVATDNSNNANTKTYIAYCFNSVKGYSKFGSYTGNGNADGPFVYLGFKPAFIMLKPTSTTGNWFILDNKRSSFNVMDKYIRANLDNAEATFSMMDFVSNGVKIITSDSSINGSGVSYIYMAFAENPFVTSTGIPTTAR